MKTDITITARQQQVLDYIRDHISEYGFAPTVREIGMAFDISSPNGVMCHLQALEKKGLIERDAMLSRSIRLTEAGSEPRGMPLVTLDQLSGTRS